MGETIFRVGVDELKTVRIRCMKCRTVVELSVDELAARFSNSSCAHCRQQLFSSGGHSPFASLQAALGELNALTNAEVEFVLPLAGHSG